MALLILFLAIVYKVKFNDILNGFMSGIKRALPLGLIIILIYSCLVIVTYHPFQLVIYKALLSGIDKFNVFGALLSSLTALLAGIFNVDPSYAFQSVLLYLTSVVTDSASYSTIGIIFQAMYGFGVIFAPTSFILMIVLEYLDIPYTSCMGFSSQPFYSPCCSAPADRDPRPPALRCRRLLPDRRKSLRCFP